MNVLIAVHTKEVLANLAFIDLARKNNQVIPAQLENLKCTHVLVRFGETLLAGVARSGLQLVSQLRETGDGEQVMVRPGQIVGQRQCETTTNTLHGQFAVLGLTLRALITAGGELARIFRGVDVTHAHCENRLFVASAMRKAHFDE
jgi:hypothetical protein